MTAAPLSPQRSLGVALVGLGFGEKVHLPALRDCPLTEPVALWHARPERLEQACAASGLPGFSSYEALLADPRVEALVIATPPEPRFALAQAAIAAGKHLLLEKPGPPAHDEATAEQIRELRTGLGLDRSFVVQFVHFLGNAVQGEFGLSLRQATKVSRLIAERFPATLELAMVAAMIALVIVYVWKNLGYAVVIYVAGLQAIPADLYEAALG